MREMTNVPDVAFTGVRGSTSTTYNKSKLNANRYATKKTIAQGMLDIALLTSNASQLRYVLQGVNGLCQIIMGPLDLNKDEWKTFLNVINYLSITSAAIIVMIDLFKITFSSPKMAKI